MRTLAPVFAIALVLSLVGCGGGNAPPATAPQVATNIADYAYKALHSVNVISQTTKNLEAAHAPGVTTENAAKVVQISYQANVVGKKLADVLDAYALLTDPGQRFAKVAEINALLGELGGLVSRITGVDLSSATAQIAALVTAIQQDIEAIKAGLAAPSAALQPVAQQARLQTPQLRTHAVLAGR